MKAALAAERMMIVMLLERGLDIDEIQSCLFSGYTDDNGYDLFIVSSDSVNSNHEQL